MSKTNKFFIEKCKKKDLSSIFRIIYSKEINKWFFSKNITFVKHKKWFEKYIKKKQKFFFVAIFKKKLVGYIRADKFNDNFLISIAVIKDFRRENVATLLLNKVESSVNSGTLIANIKKNNIKSISFFRKNKFLKYNKNKLKNIIVMKKKLKKINYSKIIEKIENVRKKNNKNWMDILRLAFQESPNEAKKIFSQIYKDDKRISSLAKLLTK